MPRSRYRARLQEGLSLDLNRLAKTGLIARGSTSGPRTICWTWTYTGERIASGLIDADMSGPRVGWLRIRIGDLDQRFHLVARPRHFGGVQWYFACPATRRICSIVWLPPGATTFASRRAWGRQVAYSSQFQTRYDRALTAAQKIRASLGGPDWAGIDETDPPKPKWMRWRTYERQIDQSRAYEAIADERLFRLIARWGSVD